MVTTMPLEITGPLKDILIIMLKPELMEEVKPPLFQINIKVQVLVGVLIKPMLKVISIKVMMKTETIGAELKIDMELEVSEIDMDKEVPLELDLKPEVLKMPMLLPDLTEEDLKIVLEVKEVLWPNLNIKTKNMLGTIVSIGEKIKKVIGMLVTIGIVKLNLMVTLLMLLKVKVGLLVKLIKITVPLLLVKVLKEP